MVCAGEGIRGMKDKGLEAVLKAAVDREDGRRVLECARAFELSERYSLPLQRIGEICNRHGIKIVRCQLGCFGD